MSYTSYRTAFVETLLFHLETEFSHASLAGRRYADIILTYGLGAFSLLWQNNDFYVGFFNSPEFLIVGNMEFFNQMN
ncbi:hypothetical protein N9L94_00020 [Robiginitalea sp.]|nr:hypothetical protein [Robiginitalea sp.]